MGYTPPLIHFEWPRAPGALVRRAYLGRSKVPVLAVCVPTNPKHEERKAPLERTNPRLFEAVADLNVGKAAAVEAFARDWGLLFGDTKWARLDLRATGTIERAAQDLNAWRRAVEGIRESRELWRAISERDRVGMGRLVTIGRRLGRSAAIYTGMFGGTAIPLPRQSLTDGARAVLAWVLTSQMDSALGVGYDRAAASPLRLVARPRDLVAAAWVQLAQCVTRDVAQTCPRCRRIFVVSLEATGRRKQHCSNACKVAMSRVRARERERRASDGEEARSR